MPVLAPAVVRLPSLRALGSLRYQPESGRDLRFDFLRGFAVLAMVVDHLAGPSVLYWVTGGNRFYTSAAEGFVFISGLIVGVVYRRLAEREGLGRALRRLLERAWQLYVLTIGLTLVVLPLSELLNLPWARGVDLSDPAGLVWSILVLHQTYYLVDIPLLYTLLLAVAPVALVLMSERRTWIVLAGSWALWAGHQIFPLRSDIPWSIEGNYLFYFSAWQVLFFTAMAMGYHRERLAAALPVRRQRLLLLVCGACFLLLLLLFRSTEPVLRALASMGELQAGPSLEARVVELLFAKGDVRFGRIVASAVVFGFLLLVTTECWKPLRRALGWLFLPLGQNALYAYSAHIVLAVAMGIVAVQAELPFGRSSGWNAVVQVVSILLIWCAIRLRLLNPRREHLRYWMASPALIAIALLAILPTDPSPQFPGYEPVRAPEPEARARAARVFGTPVSRVRREARAEDAARLGITPVPLPPPLPPVARPVAPPPPPVAEGPVAPGSSASEYVGPIQGTFREMTFYSGSLDREISYYIYLPPEYGLAQRRYPVLYMLHGGGGDKDEWPAYGLIDTVDHLIVSKEIRPFLVVLPQGDYGYWVNHINDGPRWADYVAFDLVRHIDSSFRTLPEGERRAVGGLSMGGYGALLISFNQPFIFGAVGAHSPSLRAEHELEELTAVVGTGAEFERRDPVRLAQTARGIERLQIWIDIGEEDPWLLRAEELHLALERRGIEHEWNVLPGDHSGDYWQRNIVTYLRFYDRVLHWRYPG